MGGAGAESLVEQIRRFGTEAKESAAAAIAGLAGAAGSLDMRETEDKLRQTEESLRSDTFNLMVMGRFKNGKSTLLNALMGGTTVDVDLGDHQGPMVVDDLPATATLTAVTYAEEPYVTAWHHDRTSENWSLKRYLRESTLGDGDYDEEANQRRFGHIRQFEMGFPARLCEAGVTVYDSPGLDEHPTRTAITREASRRCDAAVILYRSDALMGHNDLLDAGAVVADGTRVFTVVNRWHGRRVDDKIRGYVWNKYVRDHLGGPPWEHQDLADRDIFFVDAREAQEARYGGSGDLEASGLPEFERRLGNFLLQDRQHAHLAKFTTQATSLGEAIDKHVGQQRLAISADREHLAAAYAAMTPQLEAVRARPAKLVGILGGYRDEALTRVGAGFVQAVARIRQDLPRHLADTPLPSGETVLRVVRQKQLKAEACTAVSAFITERIDAWAESEAAPVLRDIVDRFGDDVRTEVAGIGRRFDAMHVELTGWEVDTSVSGPVVSATERIVSVAASLLVGDVGAMITGGATGYRGAAGGIAGYFGSVFVLGVLGVTAGAVLWPVTLAAAVTVGLISGAKGFEQRLKDQVVKQTDPLLATLADDVRPKIAERLHEAFTQLEQTVSAEIAAIIDEELRNLTEIVELNRRSEAEQEQASTRLDAVDVEVGAHRKALRAAQTIAQQL